jgi:hypothetical protein
MAMIGVGHLYLHALAASGTADAARVLAARDEAAGPVVVLFFAAPLAVVLLCVAAVRTRLAPWPVLVVVAAFVGLDLVPNPLGELPALVAGLLAYGWVGLGMLGLARTAPAAERAGAAAEALPAR